MQIRVCCAQAGAVRECTVELPTGSSAGAAVAASGLVAGDARPAIGIFGLSVPWDASLAPGDRVEIYHPLPVTPRERRRARATGRRVQRR